MKTLLAIDTSTSIASVAVQVESKILCLNNSSANSHIEDLQALVGKVLNEAKLSHSDIEGVVVGAGPGSFTGLRIGFGFALGLATGLKIPVVKSSSLKAYLHNVSDAYDTLVAIADARREQYFCSIYKSDFNPLVESQIYTEEEIVDKLDGKSLVIGDKKLGSIEHRLPEDIAEGLIKQADFQGVKHDLLELSDLKPDYIRPVAAKTIKERSAS